jgi:DNA-binding MarR family transcriptional regulator
MWGAGPSFRAVLVGSRDGAMREAVALAGGAVAAEHRWGEAITADPDALLIVECAGEDALDEAEALAARADVVSCALDQLDRVASAMLLTDAQFLCRPTMADRVAAIAVAAGLKGADAAPAVREGEAARLARLSAEVGRIAGVLARLAAEEGGVEDRRPAFDPGPATVPDDPAPIRAALRARRLRDGFFGEGLFEEPAWDMLLDLYAAALEGARVSVSSLCIAAAVAPTTALRWIARLEAAGLFERRPDPGDRRRAFVALSGRGTAAMRAYLAALARAGLALA